MRLWFAIFVILIQSNTLGAEKTVSGVIGPLDNDGIYVLTTAGQTTVRWDQTTQVAIKINFRNFKVANNRISYTIHSSEIKQEILLPKKEAYAKFERTQINPSEIKSSYLTPRGMKLHFTPMADHVPTATENYFAGKVDLEAKTCTIGQKTYQIRMPSGQTDVLIYDVWGVKDCKPFINHATAIGQPQGKSFIAKEIHLVPLGDQAQRDNPKLPRYLFIGDSISGNYNQSLRTALAGRFNLHHPPTNCGPSGKGVSSIRDWLGDYQQPGRHWDIISFNFGHWDSQQTKADYQGNLEFVIRELRKTGAKLIWVTTCPVPHGYDTVTPLTASGKAPGRKSGVMQRYLNPWAKEVINKYSDITICDQWQYCKDREQDSFQQWWSGRNVHFNQQTAKELGEFLANHVLHIWGS
ncbi:MAG: SGNH/GDSL hydrolase family protein [Planctomycetota bacterium]|nr:SGNH/GDSL hydrolase family protein [Planctomycetota bacterium]